jgi:nucleoside-diphosphate-sugar epimerase
MTGRERVLVTGATGFLGRPLVRRLSVAGYEVHGVSRHPPTLDDPARELPATAWWEIDLAEPGRSLEMLERLRPSVVVHLTSESRGAPDREVVEATFRNDLQATVRLLDAASRTGVRRLVMTTTLDEPLGRGAQATPATPYAAAKWAAAGYARMYAARFGLPTVILCPMMVYGPGQKPFKVIPSIILAMLAGEPPRLSSGQRPLDWVYVDDVVAAFVAAIEATSPPVGPIDLGTGRLRTVREMADRIHALIPGSPSPVFGSLPDRPDETVRRASTRQAREAFGWRATTGIGAGLHRTIESYRDQIGGAGYPIDPARCREGNRSIPPSPRRTR